MFETIEKIELKQVIHGVCPSKSNCYRIDTKKGFLYKTKALKDYEEKFYMQCSLRNKLITGYFEIYLNVFYPSERSDLDNSLKVVMDCLQRCGAIKNDNRCVKIVCQKFLDKNNPRIEFVIKEV